LVDAIILISDQLINLDNFWHCIWKNLKLWHLTKPTFFYVKETCKKEQKLCFHWEKWFSTFLIKTVFWFRHFWVMLHFPFLAVFPSIIFGVFVGHPLNIFPKIKTVLCNETNFRCSLFKVFCNNEPNIRVLQV
jgi:hypothetical protein